MELLWIAISTKTSLLHDQPPTQRDLALNFTVRGATGFDSKWTDMPLGICRIILKGMSAVTRSPRCAGRNHCIGQLSCDYSVSKNLPLKQEATLKGDQS